VGKSTLLNAILGRRNLVHTSSKPVERLYPHPGDSSFGTGPHSNIELLSSRGGAGKARVS
jgi:ribosome biogenesis GTPase A